jgi:deoxyribodipyrimidine photo-lyase
VVSVAREQEATEIHLAADCSAFAIRRLAALRAAAQSSAIEVHTHAGITVVPPGELVTGNGPTYLMFTPYYNRWRAHPWRTAPRPPRSLSIPRGIEPGELPTLGDLTTDAPAPDLVAGGETAALERMRAWTSKRLARYPDQHDAVADDDTSRASAALHFGCLSPLEVATRLRGRAGGDAFARQLCWRDFFHQLLASQPELAWTDLRDRGRPTGQADESFAAWCTGTTGYPLVDAGMRQLHAEGFIHNRIRMVVASFLTKDLDVPWPIGARFFMRHLVDGDVANNQLNWQWVAGTGTDANPHRIFNPIRQSERFDPDGVYIRRYVPELADVATKLVHDPPAAERARVGYVEKIVEHSEAIAAYRARLAG